MRIHRDGRDADALLAHLRCSVRHAPKVANTITIDILALGFSLGDYLFIALAAWSCLGVSVVLSSGFRCHIIEFACMTRAVRSPPQHNDAIVIHTRTPTVRVPCL